MKIARSGNTLRPTRRYRAFWIGLTCACGILAYTAYDVLDSIFIGSVFAFFCLSLLWLDFRFLFDQIELHDGFVRVRHAFKVASIESDQVASITKQTGMGVVFKLKNGGVQFGPDLGNATSTCNVLRAWLKKQTNVADGQI